MGQKFDKQIAALESEITAAQADADTAREIELRGRKAGLLTLSLRWSEVGDELGIIAQLVGEKGQRQNEADARFAQGRALAYTAEQKEDARRLFNQAFGLYQTTGNAPKQAESLRQIALLDLADGREPDALTHLTHAIAIAESDSVPVRPLIDLYRTRAAAHILLMYLDDAGRDYALAADLAQQVGDQKLIVEIEAEQQALDDLQNETPSAPGLQTLLRNATAAGHHRVVADTHLQQALAALQKNRLGKAARLAEKALTAAKEAEPPHRYTRYLLASVVLAEAHAAQDERVQTLIALLRCKVYVETHLGRAFGSYIDRYLDSLQQRWGADGLQTAVDAYRRHVAEHGPIEA